MKNDRCLSYWNCNDVHPAVKFSTEILGMTVAKLTRDDMGDGLSRADLRS